MGKEVNLGLVVTLLAMGLIVFAGCEKTKTAAVAQKDIAAKVGDEVITMQAVEERISKLPAYYQNVLKDRKKELVEDMVLETLLYNEAKKRDLQKDKEVQELLKEAERKIVISKLIKDEVEAKTITSDKEVEDYYNAHKEEFSLPERWKASHILVKTEEEAKAVLNELLKGKAFEEIAKEKSQDATATRGGDLGFFTKGQMVPEFEEAVTKLEVGQTSGVVKSQFGYHVIKLTDKKPASAQELKDVSARIKNELLMKKKRDAFDGLVAALKSKEKITINESLLEPPKETTTPAPASQEEQEKDVK